MEVRGIGNGNCPSPVFIPLTAIPLTFVGCEIARKQGEATTIVERDRSQVAAGEQQSRRQIIWTSPCKPSAAGAGPPALRENTAPCLPRF